MAGIDAEKSYRLRHNAGLYHHARQAIDAMDNFWELAEQRLELLQASMQRGGILEIETRRSLVALRGNLSYQRIASSVEISLNAGYLDTVFNPAPSQPEGRNNLA